MGPNMEIKSQLPKKGSPGALEGYTDFAQINFSDFSNSGPTSPDMEINPQSLKIGKISILFY